MVLICLDRRKFRSQTSDSMDRWQAETGRVREKRGVEERRSEKRKRKSQKKEDPGAPKGRKVAKHYAWICGSGGSKSRLAKAAGAEPAGQMRDETLHAVVARSTFRSQNVQSTPGSDHFWKLRCRKSAHRSGAKHISKSKCTKHTMLGPLSEVAMSKKCTPLWREAHFEVNMLKTPHVRTTFGSWDVEKVHAVVALSTFRSQNVKTPHVRTTFGRSDVVSRGRRKGLCTFSKVSKTWGFCSISKNTAGVGHLNRICQDAFSVAGAIQETCSSELLGGPGADFLRGVAFWSLRSSGLLRWFCVTGAALRMTWHHFVVAGAVVWTDGLEKSQNAMVRGRQRCTEFSIFEGSLAELLRFWCCHSFAKWRSLAELLRFWPC